MSNLLFRKPEKTEEEEETAPCPNCRYSLPRSELDCPSCKNSLPYCIVTGTHMTLDDWSKCPACSFPGLCSEFKKFLATDKQCPMCEQTISPNQIERMENPTPVLKKLLELQSATHDEKSIIAPSEQKQTR
jgi:WD repeat-containing protein 19